MGQSAKAIVNEVRQILKQAGEDPKPVVDELIKSAARVSELEHALWTIQQNTATQPVGVYNHSVICLCKAVLNKTDRTATYAIDIYVDGRKTTIIESEQTHRVAELWDALVYMMKPGIGYVLRHGDYHDGKPIERRQVEYIPVAETT